MRDGMFRRRPFLVLGAIALGLFAGALGTRAQADDRGSGPGTVYTLSNEASGNRLLVFDRLARGVLVPAGSVMTGGLGTGDGLSNQGALEFSPDGRWLFAVNPGSGTISVFALGPRGPWLAQVIPSGGQRPVSLTASGRRLYVLNAGGAVRDVDNITGFVISPVGLFPLQGSTRPLSAENTGPAQVGFNPEGNVLVVAERMTDTITTFTLDRSGLAGAPRPQPSSGMTPFGFGFNRRGTLIVSEAFGGAPNASAVSSYEVADDGTLTQVTGSAPTHQTAACWIANTSDGKFSYTTNTGSSSVTGYRVDRDGALSLLNPDGVTASTGVGTSPTDAAVIGTRFLYVLNANMGEIVAYTIGHDGSLSPLSIAFGLPAGATGLAAR